MSNQILQYALYIVILVALAIPLGKYIGKVMNGEKTFLSKAFVPVEMLADFKAHMEAILGEGRCHVLNIRPEGGAVL